MLRRCLSERAAQLTVICTISPASKDTEHSLNTLRHVCLMTGFTAPEEEGGGGGGYKPSFITGGEMEEEQLGRIDVTAIGNRNRAQAKLEGNNNNNAVKPRVLQGGGDARADFNRQLSRDQSGMGNPAEKRAAEKKRNAVIRRKDRAGLQAMSPSCREVLLDARREREAFGHQRSRLRQARELHESSNYQQWPPSRRNSKEAIVSKSSHSQSATPTASNMGSLPLSREITPTEINTPAASSSSEFHNHHNHNNVLNNAERISNNNSSKNMLNHRLPPRQKHISRHHHQHINDINDTMINSFKNLIIK